jgi:LysM repeat protein
MKGALFLLVWLTATPPELEVVVNERESLAQVAARTLGDPKAASELKAFNGLTSDAVPAGTRLKLPPPEERNKALSALSTARDAVAQADRNAARREEASAKLREAEAFLQSADYASAAKTADSAWALLSPGAAKPTSFSLNVGESGDTTVRVETGTVRVSAENKTQPVNAGQVVRVDKGKPPPAPEAVLTAPQPRTPSDKSRILRPAVNGQLGPVTLTWSSVAGAKSYEVEVLPPQGEPLRRTLTATQLQLPLLPAGSYRWTVRAVGESHKSNASAERLFELAEDKVKIEVGTTNWK